MNIKSLLEYQALEKELQDIKAAIEGRIEANFKIREQKRMLKNKIDTMSNMTQEVTNILKTCEAFYDDKRYIMETMKKISSNNEESFDDLEYALEDIEEINKQITQLSTKIESLLRYERLFDRVINLKQEHDEMKETSKNDYLEYIKSEEKRFALLSQLDEKLKPKEEKLLKIKSEIEESDFAIYLKTKESARSYPYICEFIDNRCSGCNLSDASVNKLLKKPGDTCVCPECQRLLYLLKEL